MFMFSGTILIILILLAILPAALLMLFIYRQDRIEKESPALLKRLILLGVLSAFLAMVFESIGQKILALAPLDPSSPLYIILLAFFVVALVEEGAKYLLLHRKVWHLPDFNFRFDAIVYAVFVSLGFAAMENIMYVLGFGIQVVIARALLAIPAHMSFAVAFGVFYGRARQLANRGQQAAARLHILIGFVIAVFFHGFYDSCAMIGTPIALILFALFMIVIYSTIFLVVRSESRTDERIL